MIQAFNAKLATFENSVEPMAILNSMVRTNGWHPDDILALAALPVETYYDIFRRAEGAELHDRVNACLQFDRISNSTGQTREISSKAKEALKRIGRESRINALRVSKYGVV